MNPTNCLGWAVTIGLLAALVLLAERGAVRPACERAWTWWLRDLWPWLLDHPRGGLVYVLITVLGPALLGVPNLIPKNLIWLMLGLIGLASVYGVQKTGRDAKLRDRALLEGFKGIVESERREIVAERRENESERRENESERRENEAARRRVEAARRRVEALKEEE